MLFSMIKRFSRSYGCPPELRHCTKYYWDYEYGNPEEEFVNTLNEFKTRQNKMSRPDSL